MVSRPKKRKPVSRPPRTSRKPAGKPKRAAPVRSKPTPKPKPRPKSRSSRKAPSRAAAPARRSPAPPAKATPKFVGRDASPVRDHYPPKEMNAPVAPELPSSPPPAPPAPESPPLDLAPNPPSVAAPIEIASAPPEPADPATPPAPTSLLSLERPFDVDEFAQQLGENLIRVRVPREHLGEVLTRVANFMGFGIYVYRFSVRPASSGMLKEFEVELERVDFSTTSGEWVPFQEKGQSDSPFGPNSDRS
ncbi:MAG: hypothetical protein L3K03_01025 [Thermoplasmata archaeon]|nr:hypothetical protein [Thermoplasmata archaeon]